MTTINDGLAWGIFPLYFAAAGLSIGHIGILAALYPAVSAVGIYRFARTGWSLVVTSRRPA